MSKIEWNENLFGANAKETQKLFLENYWQKKPLLIRGAFPGGFPYVDPDSLAGLACSEDVESRIVMENGPDHAWQTQHGPFEEETFAALPKTHWTLLVQAVDRIVPEVAQLREAFRFLPNWRLDDVMISYAADQGSVGPHTDNYDVFLIQAMGKRRWEYSDSPLDVIEFEEGLDLKILKNFHADQTFVLDEGDVLYIPPRVAHHGVAVGECMTYSVGFRAPTQNEMLVSFSQFLMQTENPEIFFSDDKNLHTKRLDAGHGTLLTEDKERLRSLMKNAIDDDLTFNRWIGGFLTEPRQFLPAADEPFEAEGLTALLQREEEIFKVSGVRLSYFEADGRVYFSVEGETLVLPPSLLPLAKLLSEEDVFTSRELLSYSGEAAFWEVMIHIWNQGFLETGSDD